MIVSKNPLDPITPKQWDALRAAWPNGARLEAAWRLAPDVDTLAQLLRDEPVLASKLDPAGLEWARSTKLVRLDDCAADLFDVREAA